MAQSQSPILQAMKQITEEKNIPMQSVVETVEAALAVAYRKDFGEKNQNIKVTFNPETGESLVYDVKTVVTDEKKAEWEKWKAEEEAKRAAEEAARASAPTEAAPAAEATPTVPEEEKVERFDPRTEVSVTDAQALKPGSQVGDEIRTQLFPPSSYGRMAAQTAKQVIIQRLREAERDTIFKEYKGKERSMLNGTIQRVEGRMVFVDLGHATALLPPSEQINGEQYNPGQRVKVYLVSVNSTTKGPELIVSRAHPEMVKLLFTVEVPEIASGAVEIKAIAREAGFRTKIAVTSHERNVDPVGSCVGQRGTRVQTVISELGGEKIDIIEWSDDQAKFISNALSPAKVISVKLDETNRVATAEVREDQLSLAIGKLGQNVRLASKLAGWKIDIVGEEKAPAAEAAKAPTAEAPPAAAEAPAPTAETTASAPEPSKEEKAQ